VNDDDNELARLLNDQVDERLGRKRPAPPFDAARAATAPGRRGRPSWLLPLIAAACVAAVGGTVGATRLLADHGPAPATHPPAPTVTTGPSPVPSSVAPSPTAPATASAPASASAPKRTSAPLPSKDSGPEPFDVRLGEARLVLPAGWVARDLQQYAAPETSFVVPGWCLTPSAVAVSTQAGACPIILFAAGIAQELDVDTPGGFSANPEYCNQGHEIDRESEQTGDKQFGGRTADWRHWIISCQSGRGYDIEQYVVATASAYILYSSHADGRYHRALTEIAAQAQLPAQQLPSRLMDRGIVRGLTRTGDSYRLRLDRVVERYGGRENVNPKTYDYIVPAEILAKSRVRVGSRIFLATDGLSVTQLYIAPGD
jgi:hypothetical protein